MTRRELREHCFKMLFCADFYSKEEAGEQLEQYFNEPEEDDMTPEGISQIIHSTALEASDSDYLKKKTEAIIEKISELDEKINAVAEGWQVKRMGKVEVTILRLALYEILYDEDVPEKVAINEAVDIARKFGGDESPVFVNGILAKLV